MLNECSRILFQYVAIAILLAPGMSLYFIFQYFETVLVVVYPDMC